MIVALRQKRSAAVTLSHFGPIFNSAIYQVIDRQS